MSKPIAASAATTQYWIKGLVFTALFGALFIVSSLIKIPIGITPVPISLQTFAVILAGGLLGATYGFLSIFIVVALTALGLPLMNGAGGLPQVLGPTGGFIWMFPIAAGLIGLVSDRLFARRRKLARTQIILLVLTLVVVSFLIYAGGIPWYAHIAKVDMQAAISGAMLPFIPGDLIKCAAAAAIIVLLRPALPKLKA